LAAVLAALAPALRAGRLDLAAELRSGGQGGTGVGGPPGRRPLVVAQMAIALTVLAGAGLLARSLLRLQAVDTGFPVDRLVLVELLLPQAKYYGERSRHLQLLSDVVAQLEATPGIEGATPVNTPPFSGGWLSPRFIAEGQDPERAEGNAALNLEAIHPNYFATLEVPLVRGRAFSEADGAGATEVAIVSEDVAARTWPGEDPIGKRLRFGGDVDPDPWREVVGVVRPIGYRKLTAARATLYLPASQFIVSATMFVLRTSSPLALVAGPLRERVQAVDPDVQVTRVAPLADLLQVPLARPRFNAVLLGLFGLAALLLAAVGLYAVMGASVRQRYGEIGIRFALGASPSDVTRLVVGEGLRLARLGTILGLAGAAVATRALRGLLFDVHPLDPASLLAAALLLVVASGLACYLPVRLATRVDPLSVLRDL
ncbi:MAG TPA: FtsX-like permease family protein, partial [Vicinamibacteria bacterium]